jgi:hypothetical protein
MSVIVEYCPFNFGVVQLLVVSSMAGWTAGVPMPLDMVDTQS